MTEKITIPTAEEINRYMEKPDIEGCDTCPYQAYDDKGSTTIRLPYCANPHGCPLGG